MSGRFEKAPLIYVTALIRTSSRPEFKKEEWVDFQQALIRAGLKTIKSSINHEVNISGLINMQDKEGSLSETVLSKSTRYGFFSSDEHECLIIGTDYLEFRVSMYSKFKEFRNRFFEIINAIKNNVDIISELDAKEVVLTYCDVIVPAYGRPLEEYFERGDAILPLSFLDRYQEDHWQAGQVQTTRVVTPQKKITIFLEQVPVDKQRKIGKWLPNNMIEPDPKLAMPLELRNEWLEEQVEDHFALLSTQASKLLEVSIKELTFEDTFDELHLLTKSTFNDIIDTENCKKDWIYQPH